MSEEEETTTPTPTQKHWIIRVSDGVNFRNSKYAFWGVNRGRGGCMKTITQKMKPKDILWFLTNKENGAKIIGMAEFTYSTDRDDENLIQIHTCTNEEQGWTKDDVWSIQIHYRNLYITERQNLIACIQCPATIMQYETFKKKIKMDLETHYQNFVFYAEPLHRPEI